MITSLSERMLHQILTVKQLHQLCRDNGWKGYSRLRKAELLVFVGSWAVEADDASEEEAVVVNASRDNNSAFSFHGGANLPLEIIAHILSYTDDLSTIRTITSTKLFLNIMRTRLMPPKLSIAFSFLPQPFYAYKLYVTSRMLACGDKTTAYRFEKEYSSSKEVAKRLLRLHFIDWVHFSDSVLSDGEVQAVLFDKNTSKCIRLMIQRGITITPQGWLSACNHNGRSLMYAMNAGYTISTDMVITGMLQHSQYIQEFRYLWMAFQGVEKSLIALYIVKHWQEKTRADLGVVVPDMEYLIDHLTPRIEEPFTMHKYTVKEAEALIREKGVV